MYGKTAPAKGHIAALRALEVAASSGRSFSIVACVGGHVRRIVELVNEAIALPVVSKRIWLLPFLPPWKIPRFIKACDLVSFLEHQFEIPFHSPQVPREVLSCRCSLICSGEITNKQRWASSMAPGRHYISAGDPADGDGLAKIFSEALTDIASLRTLGAAGRAALLAMEQETSVEDAVIRTLRRESYLPPPAQAPKAGQLTSV